ncbi:MAG: PEGA domain-containing protein [Myxococcota bacterium]
MRRAAIIDISESSAGGAKVAREVERALSSNPDFAVQDIHATLNAGSEGDNATNIKSAQAFRTAGLAALAEGQTDDAAEQLQSALGLMSRSFAHLRDTDEFRQLLVELGAVQLRSGAKSSARATFLQAAVFGAETASIPLEPAELAMLAAAREESKAAPRGAIQISSTPAAAEAWVDGRFVGVTPCPAAGLTAGTHIIALYKAGYAPVTATATANAEAFEQASVQLEPARRKLIYDDVVGKLRGEVDALESDHPQGGDGVKQAGSLFLSEVALVVRTRGKGSDTQVELFLFDTQSQKLLRKEAGTVDPTSRGLREAIAPMVARVSDIQWAVALGGEVDDPTKRAKKDRLVRKWWFWTIIGAVVAGGVTAAVVLSKSDKSEPAPATTGSVVLSF